MKLTLTAADHVLILICAKCTRLGEFPAEFRRDAESEAARKGWVVRHQKVICPSCPK